MHPQLTRQALEADFMVIDKQFLRTAQEAFCPFSPFSGTENVAPLLYSLVRLARPRVVVECGSGYTTLFILAALAENTADTREEEAFLRDKTAALGDLKSMDLNFAAPAIKEWFGQGAKACGVDPAYYLNVCRPHLYSFEEQGEDHEYSQRMSRVVESLRLTEWFSHLKGAKFSAETLPAEARPVDLAWNDAHDYKEFFEKIWPALNPKGGVMIFHNTVSRKYGWDAIQWMKAKRSLANDLEVMTLPEIHKLDQSSCTILRRTTQYQPPCLTRNPEEILHSAMQFMEKQG
jgi:predicted O-methyltransferase YrrM